MNYAQQSLDLTTAALQQARATFNDLRALLEGPLKPQQLTLATVAGSVTVPMPAFEGGDAGIASTFYAELIEHAQMRVDTLEREQLSWCAEALLIDKQEQQASQAREAAREAQAAE